MFGRLTTLLWVVPLFSTVLADCNGGPQQYNSIPGIDNNGCVPSGYYQAQDMGTITPDALRQSCASVCSGDSRCEAYVGQYQNAADSNKSTGQCYYYAAGSVPTAPASCVNKPSGIFGSAKDRSLACFASSQAVASTYCSSLLSIGTVTVFTTTVSPVTTATATSQITISNTATLTSSTVSVFTPATSVSTSTQLFTPATSLTTTATTQTPPASLSTATSHVTFPTSIETDTTVTTPISVSTSVTTTTTTFTSAPVVKRAAKAVKAAATRPACIPSTVSASRLSSACSCLSLTSATVYRESTAKLSTSVTTSTVRNTVVQTVTVVSSSISTAPTPSSLSVTISTLPTPVSTVSQTSTAPTPQSTISTLTSDPTPLSTITVTSTAPAQQSVTLTTTTSTVTQNGCAANCLRSSSNIDVFSLCMSKYGALGLPTTSTVTVTPSTTVTVTQTFSFSSTSTRRALSYTATTASFTTSIGSSTVSTSTSRTSTTTTTTFTGTLTTAIESTLITLASKRKRAADPAPTTCSNDSAFVSACSCQGFSPSTVVTVTAATPTSTSSILTTLSFTTTSTTTSTLSRTVIQTVFTTTASTSTTTTTLVTITSVSDIYIATAGATTFNLRVRRVDGSGGGLLGAYNLDSAGNFYPVENNSPVLRCQLDTSNNLVCNNNILGNSGGGPPQTINGQVVPGAYIDNVVGHVQPVGSDFVPLQCSVSITDGQISCVSTKGARTFCVEGFGLPGDLYIETGCFTGDAPVRLYAEFNYDTS